LKVWRICKRKYADSAFEGVGAKKAGGRWNSRGTAVVYTSESLALAALELLVHLNVDEEPPNLVALRAEVPDDLPMESVEIDEMPEGWRRVTGHTSLADRGDAWQAAGQSSALSVPSVVVPEERNILLNPEHPDFESIEIGEPRDFTFDERLFAL
jgi:RES domain-containing protein